MLTVGGALAFYGSTSFSTLQEQFSYIGLHGCPNRDERYELESSREKSRYRLSGHLLGDYPLGGFLQKVSFSNEGRFS